MLLWQLWRAVQPTELPNGACAIKRSLEASPTQSAPPSGEVRLFWSFLSRRGAAGGSAETVFFFARETVEATSARTSAARSEPFRKNTETPVAASLSGPDPLEDPEHYAGLPMDLFTHSTSGRHLVTHHMVSTRRPAHSEVAERAREALGPEETNLSVGLLDLTWDPGRYGASGCRLGDPAHRKGWYFGRPEEASPGSEPTISPWPFAFEGFRSLDLVEGRSERIDTDSADRIGVEV